MKELSQGLMLMYGKEASNRKQEIDRQHRIPKILTFTETFVIIFQK